VVSTELVCSTVSENADAIGWDGYGRCMVIECKVSRSDFLANKHKPHEIVGDSMGNERWFMTPPGLVEPKELPRSHGLLEYTPSGHGSGYFIRKVKKARPRKRTVDRLWNENRTLVAIAGRALEAASRLKPLWLGDGEDE